MCSPFRAKTSCAGTPGGKAADKSDFYPLTPWEKSPARETGMIQAVMKPIQAVMPRIKVVMSRIKVAMSRIKAVRVQSHIVA